MAGPTDGNNTAQPGTDAPPPALLAAIRDALADSALPDEDLDASAAARDEAAAFVAATALVRSAGTPAIALETLAGEAGARRMRLAIINDDMPFLVDSVAGAVSTAGLVVARIIHPVVAVRRDADGRLTDVLDRGASGERRESMIYMEMERADARTRRSLLADIEAVLGDVRAAVTDWLKLQAVMTDDAARLGDGEAAALLRWFLDRNFTLLGHEQRDRNGAASGMLGICRSGGQPLLAEGTLQAAIQWFERGGRVPLIVKSNRTSTVHRRVLIDLVILPVHGASGIEGLSIHAGLWTSAALSSPPEKVPVLRTALAELITKFGFDPSGHAGKALAHVLTQLPHDLLVATDSAQLEAIALDAMSIADRPRPKLAFILSPLKRHLFAFVWLPRDEVSTARRTAIQDLLTARANARLLSWSISMEDGGAALLRYTLDLRDGGQVPDVRGLDAELEAMVRGWTPGVEAALAQLVEPGRANALAGRFAQALPQSYRLTHSADDAAQDILRLRDLSAERPVDVRIAGVASIDDDRILRLIAR
jgi:glutamate dehydrogenase